MAGCCDDTRRGQCEIYRVLFGLKEWRKKNPSERLSGKIIALEWVLQYRKDKDLRNI